MQVRGRRMNPALKKVVAAVAAKEAIERIQEIRKSRRSFLRRNGGKILLLGGIAAGIVILSKKGKLPVGGGRERFTGYRDGYPTGPGTDPITIPEASDSTLEPSRV